MSTQLSKSGRQLATGVGCLSVSTLYLLAAMAQLSAQVIAATASALAVLVAGGVVYAARHRGQAAALLAARSSRPVVSKVAPRSSPRRTAAVTRRQAARRGRVRGFVVRRARRRATAWSRRRPLTARTMRRTGRGVSVAARSTAARSRAVAHRVLDRWEDHRAARRARSAARPFGRGSASLVRDVDGGPWRQHSPSQ